MGFHYILNPPRINLLSCKCSYNVACYVCCTFHIYGISIEKNVPNIIAMFLNAVNRWVGAWCLSVAGPTVT